MPDIQWDTLQSEKKKQVLTFALCLVKLSNVLRVIVHALTHM